MYSVTSNSANLNVMRNILSKREFGRLVYSIWQPPMVSYGPWASKVGTLKYSVEVLGSFVSKFFHDFRDLSTYKPKWVAGKPVTPFEHLLHNFVKKMNSKADRCVSMDLTNVANFDVVATARELYTVLDTEFSRSLISMLDAEDLTGVLKASVSPNDSIYANNSDLFYRDYTAMSFLRKYEGIDLGIDKVKNTMLGWTAAERQCKLTNQRFENADFSSEELRFLNAVRIKVQRILGACPSMTKISSKLRFGPGTTLNVDSRFTSVIDKVERSQYAGSAMRGILPRLLENNPEFRALTPVYGAIPYVAFVPKKWDILRDIEIPVDYDVLLQLSLGACIRERLRAFGLDLDSQADRNGKLAEFGSLYDTISTIDLKAASNTIAYRLVEFLLPKGWFNLLNACRARTVEFREINHIHMNQKFSAMGNGYTFELESLIFLCVTLVACDSHHKRKLPNYIGIFGDDICCPSIDAPKVIEGLELCGFSINTEKSFIQGPFRESCGQDFFLGAPVRPYFQKKGVTDVTQLFTMANGIRRCAVRSACNYASDSRFAPLWRSIVRRIPLELRVFGPSESGDTVIWGNPSDGVDGEWAIQLNGCWSYRDGPLSAIGRGINYYAYSGGALITAWGLIKGNRVSNPFSKKNPSGHNTDASTLPKNHREWRKRLRYNRSSLTPSLKSDCPAFL